mgnify:CR=1 FL=1
MKNSLKRNHKVKRRWGLATRLKYPRVAGKNRKKPGREK